MLSQSGQYELLLRESERKMIIGSFQICYGGLSSENKVRALSLVGLGFISSIFVEADGKLLNVSLGSFWPGFAVSNAQQVIGRLLTDPKETNRE